MPLLDDYGRSGNIVDRRTSTYVKPFALDRISRLADHPAVVATAAAAAMAAAVCTVVHAYYESVLRSPRKRPDPRNWWTTIRDGAEHMHAHMHARAHELSHRFALPSMRPRVRPIFLHWRYHRSSDNEHQRNYECGIKRTFTLKDNFKRWQWTFHFSITLPECYINHTQF